MTGQSPSLKLRLLRGGPLHIWGRGMFFRKKNCFRIQEEEKLSQMIQGKQFFAVFKSEINSLPQS